MIGPAKIPRDTGEAVDEVSQLCHIAVKITRRRGFVLLIDFPQSFEAFRPRNRHPERTPLQEPARIWKAGRGNDDKSQIEFVSIAKVANHLVRGHFSPAAWAGGTNVLQTREDLIFVERIEQSAHCLGLRQIRTSLEECAVVCAKSDGSVHRRDGARRRPPLHNYERAKYFSSRMRRWWSSWPASV